MTVYLHVLSFLFGVINVVYYFLCSYNFIRNLVLCNRRKVRGGRLSDLGCPDFVGTTGLGCCIPPCFLESLKSTVLLISFYV